MTAVVVTLALVVGGLLTYRHLNGNINALDTDGLLGSDRPEKVTVASEELDPLNILLLGSDTREGIGNSSIGGETPGLSDTTILLHLSADRERAYGVSLPRDAMVERPECVTEDGSVDAGGLSMFNQAYAAGGPACTQRTVETLTGIHIDHFVVVDFAGFKKMVDALWGVSRCACRGRSTTMWATSISRPAPTRSRGTRHSTTSACDTRSRTTATSAG
jgi:LCP family protein required for cell wall assembly